MPTKKNPKVNKPVSAYTVERAVKKRGDLQFDITTIPKKFDRTRGHWHKNGEREVFTILQGQALFFCKSGKQVSIAVLGKGDKIIVSGKEFHSFANVGDVPLKVGNWVYKYCIRVYTNPPNFRVI